VTNNYRSGVGTSSRRASRFQPTLDTVYERIGEEAVLVHMGTNRIYELNRTGMRFWEPLCAGYDRAEIQRLMLQEFDVAEAALPVEIEAMLTSLENEGLITSYNEG
jgi:hypothetical protein